MNSPVPGPACGQDVTIGDVTISPSLNRIAIAHRQCRLQPRVMQVLLLLARHQGRSVTRDELLEQCWGGVFVAEDSLNRSIFQLRRALREVGATSLRVETIPKIGYSLVVDAPPPPESPAPESSVPGSPVPGSPGPLAPSGDGDGRQGPPPVPTPGQGEPATRVLTGMAARLPLLMAVALLLVVLLVLGLLHHRREGDFAAFPAYDMRALTLEPGMNLYPALSPDGKMAAYAHRNSFGDTDLMLRSTAPGGQATILTQTEDNDRYPVWSPQGDQLAFVRVDLDWNCRLHIISIPAGKERLLAPCLGDHMPHLTWRPDGRALVLTALTDGEPGRSRLMSVPLDGGPPSPVPVPADVGADDWMPAYSPDGSLLAFVRALPGRQMVLLVGDARTGHERRRLPLEPGISHFAWAADGQGFYVTNGSRRRRGLWHVDMRTGRWQQIMPSIGRLGLISVDRTRGTLLVETYRGHSDIVEFGPSGNQHVLLGSTANEYEPQLSPDGRVMAFVSDRLGGPQVWLAVEDGPPRPLTDLRATILTGLRWSPDGGRLLFVVENGTAHDLYQVEPASGQTTRLTQDGRQKGIPVWLPDGGIGLPVLEPDGWTVWSLEPGRDLFRKTEMHHDFIDLSQDRTMLLTGNTGTNQLNWRMLDGSGAGTLDLPFTLRRRNLVVCPDTIYAARVNRFSAEVIAIDRLTGWERRLGILNRTELQGQISADCGKGSVLMASIIDQEAGLALITPDDPD